MKRPFSAVINAFMNSPKFLALAANTQISYRHHLILAEKVLGTLPTDAVKPSVVQVFLDGMADKPGKQQKTLVGLKAMERWAVVRDLLDRSITLGVEVEGHDGAHQPWTAAQVECAIAGARPDIARVILLAAATGQRGSDLCRMTWADIEKVEGRYGINVTQKKTGLQIWVPMTEGLEEALTTWGRGPTPLLLKMDGTRWEGRHQMSEAWNRERDRNPALAPCHGLVLHGLRAFAVIRLRRLGARATQIADMIGMSVQMVERYCRGADQKVSATAAVLYLDRKAGRTENEQKIRKSVSGGEID